MTANPNQNFNLVYGWSAQANVATGQAGPGYGQPGNAPATAIQTTALQPTSGDGFSPAGTGMYGSNEVLTNVGYAGNPGLITPGPVTAPSLPTSGTGIALNPSALEAAVTIVTGGAATVTAVSIAPAGSSTFTAIGFTLAINSDGQIQVPGAGQVKITYTGTPTWTWIAVN